MSPEDVPREAGTVRATTLIWLHRPTGNLYSIHADESGAVTLAAGPLQSDAVVPDAASRRMGQRAPR